jgi:hypothetical protein
MMHEKKKRKKKGTAKKVNNQMRERERAFLDEEKKSAEFFVLFFFGCTSFSQFLFLSLPQKVFAFFLLFLSPLFFFPFRHHPPIKKKQ